MTTKSEPASAANLHCPLLSLSNEIITSIVYLLHPREAIFLSLTCRALHHGVLSDNNHYLWYRVGRFAEWMSGQWMMGQWASGQWTLGKRLDLMIKGPSNVDANAEKRKKNPMARKPMRKDLTAAVGMYSPGEVVVEYKKVLVDTMLGDTDSGCQWCLVKPMTWRVYETWKLRLCEWCFHENAITMRACKPLEIDISHLPVQVVQRRGWASHVVWMRAVQHLADEKYGDTKPLFERLDLLNNEKQAKKDAAAEGLAVYRERHFVAIFEEIKRQYRELYEQHEKMGFTEVPLGRILEKITPERLKLEWFMEPRRNGKYFSHQNYRWTNFNKNDPLMQELKSKKEKEKWNDAAWVQEKAREKVANMQKLFSIEHDVPGPYVAWTMVCHSWDIPTWYMRNEVETIAKEWHIKRAVDGGVDELVTKIVAQNGDGIMCPWAHWCIPFPISGTLESFIEHIRIFHWDIYMLGDTDWLVGRPSRWWLQNAVQNGMLGATDEDRKNGTAYFSRVIQQRTWLQRWWPDRWKAENVRTLQGWMDNGGFYGHNGY